MIIIVISYLGSAERGPICLIVTGGVYCTGGRDSRVTVSMLTCQVLVVIDCFNLYTVLELSVVLYYNCPTDECVSFFHVVSVVGLKIWEKSLCSEIKMWRKSFPDFSHVGKVSSSWVIHTRRVEYHEK